MCHLGFFFRQDFADTTLEALSLILEHEVRSDDIPDIEQAAGGLLNFDA